MRIFKIVSVTVLLLAVAFIVLWGLKDMIPSQNPTDDALSDYDEDQVDGSEDIYSQQLKQYEGTVKLLGVPIYMEGTHRLEKDDKLVALLGSEKINLPDFENKEVRVRGFVRDTVEGGQKIMDVVYLEILEEAGVKAFNDASYEFSFSYPTDWEVSKEAGKVKFLQQNGTAAETIMVVYQYEDVDQPLDVWLSDRDQNLFYEEAQVKVGQTTGVRRSVKNGDQEIIKSYVKEGNNAYELRLLSQDEVTRNQYFSIVDFFRTSFVADENQNADPSDQIPDPSDQIPNPGDQIPDPSDQIPNPGDQIPESSVQTPLSTESFTNLLPLSSADIDRLLEKGFSPFVGRGLSFNYPKVWFFAYLGNGKYGFTDDKSYESNNDEVNEEVSRILIISGETNLSCSYQKTRNLAGDTYTVCAREPGLDGVVDKIAESITR